MEEFNSQDGTVVVNDLSSAEKYPPVSFNEWMLTMLLISIPIAGFVLLVVWGFSADINPSKANWAKAALVWMAILILLNVIFFAIIFLIVGSSFNELMKY